MFPSETFSKATAFLNTETKMFRRNIAWHVQIQSLKNGCWLDAYAPDGGVPPMGQGALLAMKKQRRLNALQAALRRFSASPDAVASATTGRVASTVKFPA
jgi:hypothetical protein